MIKNQVLFAVRHKIEFIGVVKTGSLSLEKHIGNKIGGQSKRFGYESNHELKGIEIILQEYSVVGEEAIFENKTTWEYAIKCNSVKALVYLIPVNLFRNLPPKVLEKLKEIYQQKMNFRTTLLEKKKIISEANLASLTKNSSIFKLPLKHINNENFNTIIMEKIALKHKSLMMNDIQKLRILKAKKGIKNQIYDDCVSFGNIDFELRKLGQKTTRKAEEDSCSNQRENIRIDLSSKVIQKSFQERSRTYTFREKVH